MKFDDATSAAGRVLRRRPTKVLPPFLGESALGILAQSTVVVGAAIALFSLQGTKRLANAIEAFRRLNGEGSPTQAEIEAFRSSVVELVTPTVALLGGIAVVAAVAVAVLVRSVVGAAKAHTTWAALTDGNPTEAAVGGALADSRRFVRLSLLQLVVFGSLPLLAGIFAAGGARAVAGLLILLWLPIAVVGYFLFLFVPQIIAVEDAGVREAIGLNRAFLGDHLGRGLLFAGLEVGVLVVSGAMSAGLGVAGASRVSGMVSLLVLSPFVGLVKMGLYLDLPPRYPDDRPPAESTPGAERRPAEPRATHDGRDDDRTATGGRDDRPVDGRDRYPPERPPDRPRTDRRDDEIYADRPPEDTRREDRRPQDRPRSDRRADEAYADRPPEDTRREDRRSPDRSRREPPRDERPEERRPRADHPPEDRPRGRPYDEPRDDRPPEDRPRDPPHDEPRDGRSGEAGERRWDRPEEGRRRPRPQPVVGPEAEPDEPIGGESLTADLRALFRVSWGELRSFVWERSGLVAASLTAFFVGILAGYRLTAATGINLVEEGNKVSGFGAFPLGTAVNLTANNWQVAVGQTFAGLAFGVPTLINLVFNGLIVGGLGGLGFDLVTFAALIVPHGLLEVPALAVSGALGFHLAGKSLELARGDLTAEEGGEELERAFLILVGLLPVFLVAGFVEAFLTPAVGNAVAGFVP